jgi:hypothetical protein
MVFFVVGFDILFIAPKCSFEKLQGDSLKIKVPILQNINLSKVYPIKKNLPPKKYLQFPVDKKKIFW